MMPALHAAVRALALSLALALLRVVEHAGIKIDDRSLGNRHLAEHLLIRREIEIGEVCLLLGLLLLLELRLLIGIGEEVVWLLLLLE